MLRFQVFRGYYTITSFYIATVTNYSSVPVWRSFKAFSRRWITSATNSDNSRSYGKHLHRQLLSPVIGLNTFVLKKRNYCNNVPGAYS